MTDETAPASPQDWAVVEIMGHRRRAGRISEVTRFGAPMLCVEIPQADGTFVVEYYGGPSIFCLTPCTEERARKAALPYEPAPSAYLEDQRISDAEFDADDASGDMFEDDTPSFLR